MLAACIPVAGFRAHGQGFICISACLSCSYTISFILQCGSSSARNKRSAQGRQGGGAERVVQQLKGTRPGGMAAARTATASTHRTAAYVSQASRQVGRCPRVDKQHGAKAGDEGEQDKQVAGVGTAASPPPNAPPHLLHCRAQRVAAACVPAAGGRGGTAARRRGLMGCAVLGRDAAGRSAGSQQCNCAAPARAPLRPVLRCSCHTRQTHLVVMGRLTSVQEAPSIGRANPQVSRMAWQQRSLGSDGQAALEEAGEHSLHRALQAALPPRVLALLVRVCVKLAAAGKIQESITGDIVPSMRSARAIAWRQAGQGMPAPLDRTVLQPACTEEGPQHSNGARRGTAH